MRFTVFTLTLLAAATTSALAAEAQPSAWLRVQTDVPYDGKAPLYFNFQPDEAVCKKQYGDDWQQRAEQYAYHAKPFTKESLLYRDIFEKHYPGQGQMISGFWMPNQSWEGCRVNDPSARVLSNYGASGQ